MYVSYFLFPLLADTENDFIRDIDVSSGAVTTLAGTAGQTGIADGQGYVAQFTSVAVAHNESIAIVG
jgi:hypothetical protein